MIRLENLKSDMPLVGLSPSSVATIAAVIPVGDGAVTVYYRDADGNLRDRLWKDDNKDLMILPGSLPLQNGDARNELTYYLPAGWDAVVEKDIDGDRAETTELENKEPRFGQTNAARRVARTLFLGSAPSSVAGRTGTRGLDRARILLGCLQPGQTSATYSDALSRLADRLHYLNSSGDKNQDTTRYWFDTRANLRREMEDRKRRFDETDVRAKIQESVKKMLAGEKFFDGLHIFTSHADVPDTSDLRLVVLSPEQWFTREEQRTAEHAVLEYIRQHGTKPRYRGNRLLFLAPDMSVLGRMKDVARTALAWNSIVEDVKDSKLNIDILQKKQAEKELESANEVVPRAARECYKWLLCPVQESATDPKPKVEAFPLNTGGSSVAHEIERVCTENELVISRWSPIHLRNKLKEFYWKDDKTAVAAKTFWEDTLRYLYLPRLNREETLAQAIIAGSASTDFFGTAYDQEGDKLVGFQFGSGNVQFDDTLLLVEPQAAAAYATLQKAQAAETAARAGQTAPHGTPPTGTEGTSAAPTSATPGIARADATAIPPTVSTSAPKPKLFHGSVPIKASTARVKLLEVANEIIELLNSDPNATVTVTLEIQAEFPAGASDQIRRSVSENATTLQFKTTIWE